MKLYNTLKIISATAMGILIFSSCTDKFESINNSEYGVTSESLKQDFNHINGPLKTIQNNIYVYSPAWKTQLQQNLIGDVFSGYMSPPTPFAGNINNMTYALVDGWNTFAWDIAYGDVMSNYLKVKQRTKDTDDDKFNDFYAITQILKVEAMHKVTDIYGPIIYSRYGTEDAVVSYDAQKDVYTQLFKDLDEAVAELDARIKSGKDSPLASADDTKYAGDYAKWVKFANSLRLRLAMRIANVSPTIAQQQAETAIAQTQGVIEMNDDSAIVTSANFRHPVETFSNVWGDARMGAPMESYLTGYDDPRLAKFFVPAKEGGQYKGIRQGIEIEKKAQYVDHTSRIGSVVETNEIVWLNAAEVAFLRAEGALRGWNMGGTAETFYNSGIDLSLAQHGVADPAYKTDDTKTPAAYVDPIGKTDNDTQASEVSDITIKWDDADTNERKLERIITQKWIALFPDGQEAWSEFRRTGYPKLFKVKVNKSNGKIDTDKFVRRINFPLSQKNGNAEGLETGLKLLGGEDNGGTNLWWDTGSNNL